MSHLIIETAVGSSNIMPKPNLKTHVQAPKYICARLISSSFSNRPRSIYQYSNMDPRLSGQTSIFGVVFFVSKSLLGIERQKKL